MNAIIIDMCGKWVLISCMFVKQDNEQSVMSASTTGIRY